MKRTLTAAAFVAMSAGSAIAAAPVTTGKSAAGPILTDTHGMALYTFDMDADGTSNCNDQCAVNWPPLFAGAHDTAEGDYTIIKRSDGKKQWAYKDQPLYLWVKDTAPGDITGDGVKDVWHLARP